MAKKPQLKVVEPIEAPTTEAAPEPKSPTAEEVRQILAKDRAEREVHCRASINAALARCRCKINVLTHFSPKPDNPTGPNVWWNDVQVSSLD